MKGKDYEELLERYDEITRLGQISGLLMWDQNVYMPEGSIRSRAAQNSLITGLIHQRFTSKRMGELINSLADQDLEDDQNVVLREISRQYYRNISIPEDLAKEISKAEAEGTQIWTKARKNDDFASFSPALERMIGLKMDLAEKVGYEDRAYDALLEEYEPYMRSREVISIFKDLRSKLVPLVEKIASSGSDIDTSPVKGDLPKSKQYELSRKILEDMGYDFNIGRLDETAHPFTIGSMDDVRITTRFNEGDLRSGIFACIHEGGHALYEMGYEESNYCTPLSEPASLGIHESQSRFWENIVGRSLSFWKHYLPHAQGSFPSLKEFSEVDIFKAVNSVKPSLIRVEADEVTYNLHVLIRFEIESDIYSGKLDVKEIPQAWNDKYEKYLGVRPEGDADGCLQDIHWAVGYFGYFPTYTLGNLYSGMIREAMIRDIGDINDIIEKGDLRSLLSWLRKNIHNHGKRYPAKELISRSTGMELTADPFIDYLKEKYSNVYGITL